MKTEALIAQLAGNAHPVRRLAPPVRRAGLWLAIALPLCALGAAAFGYRSDMDMLLAVQVAAAIATGLVAAWAAMVSTVPGLPGWSQALPLIPGSAWLALVGSGCWREISAMGGPAVATKVAQTVCMPEVVGVSLIPALVLVVMARRGAPLRPARTAALATLAAASLASALLTLAHEQDAAVTELVWHIGTVALMSGLAALAGDRLFRSARLP